VLAASGAGKVFLTHVGHRHRTEGLNSSSAFYYSRCRIMSISEDVGSLTLPNEPTRSYFGSTRLRSCTPP